MSAPESAECPCCGEVSVPTEETWKFAAEHDGVLRPVTYYTCAGCHFSTWSREDWGAAVNVPQRRGER